MAELQKLGRYELRSVLGKGAMGVVYEGFDPMLNRRVAVKTILKTVAMDAETQRDYSARFVREAQAVGRLNHPNIVQVHDFGVENEVSYLVMEFIQGRELRSYFDAREKFSSTEAVRVIGELLDALHFAHEAGVIHRDVKPANVMLDAQLRVKLADFGVARVQDSDRSAAGTMVGTPAFMSPEQISGGKIDRRTDVFSAGVVLYQLLTGEQPFRGEGAWTVARQIMQDDPTPPSALVTNISPAYDALIDKALAKNPAERFASAHEFARALRATVGGAPAPAIVPPKPRPKPEVQASETEIEFWRAIQNSSDAAEIEFYLERFPEGTYAPLARHKIAKLKEGSSPEAQATQRLEAEAKARQEAEARAKAEAEEKALREALEKTRRDAAEKAKREAGQANRAAQAAARAKPAVDENATIAIAGKRPAARTTPYAAPLIAAAVAVMAGVAAYVLLGRTPAPVAQAPEAPQAAAPAPKAELSATDMEKIRGETEERIRREYADKSAAEQAAAAKAAGDKAIQEKQLALKAAAEKAAAEKTAAEKAAQERQFSLRLEAERAAAEKATSERLAAEKAAAEKLAAEKAAAAKAAEERLAAAKAAMPAKPAPASVAAASSPALREGLAGRYAIRLMPGAGSWPSCDQIDIQEDIEIRADGGQSASGKGFADVRFQSAQDGSVAATMRSVWTRFGSGDASLTGRATATGYAGTYDWRWSAVSCAGNWSLVRKGERVAAQAPAAAKAPPAGVAAAPREAILAGRFTFRLAAGSGGSGTCDRNGFEEDIDIRGGDPQSISGRQFTDLQIRSLQDGSIAGTLRDESSRVGVADVKLAGRATAAGYAGTYDGRYGIFACAGQWSLVRK